MGRKSSKSSFKLSRTKATRGIKHPAAYWNSQHPFPPLHLSLNCAGIVRCLRKWKHLSYSAGNYLLPFKSWGGIMPLKTVTVILVCCLHPVALWLMQIIGIWVIQSNPISIQKDLSTSLIQVCSSHLATKYSRIRWSQHPVGAVPLFMQHLNIGGEGQKEEGTGMTVIA